MRAVAIDVCIIGLGYVGLPLAVEFAGAGLRTVGIDVNREKVDGVNRGVSHVPDVPEERLRGPVSQGLLGATTDFSALREADAVCICVPTPLTKTMDPDISHIVASVEEVARHLHPGMLVVLESTTYPGTTEELALPRLEASGLKAGRDFHLAFSPERVDPGNRHYGTRNTPKVIGGLTPACTERAAALYRHAVDTVVPVSTPAAAEMVKLLENTFRAINIGLANEAALMCERLGVDVWEVIDAASTKPFGFMPFYPGPGLGGHCIPIDPLYLSWKMKTANYTARFIELATSINSAMPEHVANRIGDALNLAGKSVRDSRILILGAAYKPGVADIRESPALDIMGLLSRKGAEIAYADPYVPELALPDRTLKAHPPEAGFGGFDCAAIITNHAGFDYARLVGEAPLVYDARNALRGVKIPASCRVVRL